MAKKDALSTTYPVKIRYRTSDLADSSRLTGFQKQTEQAFRELEKAIGDIYNTENATNSVLSSQPLYINSLGRALGSMANIVPPLSGINEFSPTLASKMSDATYNVIPHPNQSVKCEVGCIFDGYDPSDATPTRKCLAGFDAFYRQVEGAVTSVCQTESCPGWSGRDGQTIEYQECDPNLNSKIFRQYKLVLPTEQRTVDKFKVRYYSNAGGSEKDRFRTDTGATAFNAVDKSDPVNTWALAVNVEASGVIQSVQYDYPNLDATAGYIVVVEVPAVDTTQRVLFNNITFGSVNSTSAESRRYLFDLSSIDVGTNLQVKIQPSSEEDGATAAVSQLFIIEQIPQQHRNHGIPLLLPQVLESLSPGSEIPPNFVQIFDVDPSVNRIIEKARVFKTRFKTQGSENLSTDRGAFDIKIFDDQQLEVGNDRYLAVTTGTDVAKTVGALLDAFVEHVTDTDIHLSEETICELLRDKSFCCEDRFFVQLASLSPSNRRAGAAGIEYEINTYIYGAIPPYTITINWGDNSNDSANNVVSGTQTLTLDEDRSPQAGTTFTARHTYTSQGTFNVSYVVTDDEDEGFGCRADISNLVSPFNVGSPPTIDLEVRLDNISSYPNHVFTDIDTGYNFTVTEDQDWTADPNFHIITQIHSIDEEDGKPWQFEWVISNPEGMSYQFYYENVTQISGEALSFTAYSGTLANDFIQQDSLVLKGATGQIYEQGVDYNVNWISGTVTAAVGVSISGGASVTARYFYYPYMTLGDDPTTVDSASRWTALSTVINSTTIDFADLTNKTDINTIRFKIREF